MRFRRGRDASPRRIRTTRWRPPKRAVAVLLLVAVGLGVVAAERRATAEDLAAAAAARDRLVPLLDELDVLWRATDPTGPGGVLTALQAGSEPAAVAPEPVAEAWDAAHGALLVRLVGLDLPTPALGAQRQAVAAFTLAADAADAVARAGEVREASGRRELVRQAVRMRLRSEQLAAGTLAAIEELRTGRRRIAPLPALEVEDAGGGR